MYNFDFYNPTHIVFGKDRLDELDTLVPKDAKVLITYGGGSAVHSGLIDRIVKALGNRKVEQFGGIEPNPSLETCERAVAFIKEHGVDFVLAVGGGSVVDATKLIVMGATYDGPVIDVMKAGVPEVPVEMVPNPLPFGTVMTLPATGSEMNNGAVITYGDGKFPVFSSLVFPKFSMLDPTLTFTLPEKQVKNGVIDTFVHTTEQYLTYPVEGRIQDRFSEGILKTMIEIGKETVENPENYDIRANHVWASTLALNGLIGAGVPQDWATHLIGHELTAYRFILEVHENYRSQRSVAWYAARAKLSPGHFSTIIRHTTGKTPSEWIATITVTYAKFLLEESDKPVKEIAQAESVDLSWVYKSIKRGLKRLGKNFKNFN